MSQLEKDKPADLNGKATVSSRLSLRQENQINLTSDQEERLREAFNMFDTDGDGTIDQSELRYAMFAMGFLSKGEQKPRSNSMIETLELNQSKSIDFEQFTALMKGSLTSGRGVDEIHRTFQAIVQIDISSSNPNSIRRRARQTITFEHLKQACHFFDVRLVDEELKSIFSEVDIDNSGEITQEQYVHILKNAPWY